MHPMEARRQSDTAATRLAAVMLRLKRALVDDPARAFAEHGFGQILSTVPAKASFDRIGAAMPPRPEILYGGGGMSPDDPPLDLLLVAAGVRPLALVHGPEPVLLGLGSWARARGLIAWLSAHEFVPIADADRVEYANLAREWRPARRGSGAWRGIFISSSADAVAIAWLAAQLEWDEVLGNLLGYPTCCTRAFAEHWPRARQIYGGDPGAMLMTEGNECDHYPWRLNVNARYLGPTLIDWFPCRFDCAHSLAAARRVEWALSLLAPHLLPSIRERMETTVFQIDGEGTLFLGRDERRVLPENADGPAARALRSGLPARRDGPHQLMIGDRQFAGTMTAFTADEPQYEEGAA